MMTWEIEPHCQDAVHSASDTSTGCILHTFLVENKEIHSGEVMQIIGNTPELGNWKLDKALPMELESQQVDKEVWKVTVSLPKHTEVYYRYLLIASLDRPIVKDDGKPIKVVRHWETYVDPRCITTTDNGVQKSALDTFGIIGGVRMLGNGWLSDHAVVHLKLYNSPIPPIEVWKRKFVNQKYRVKVTPVDLEKGRDETTFSLEESTEEEQDHIHWPIVEVSTMTTDDFQFCSQDQFGKVYHDGDYMLFQSNALRPETIAYMVDFYVDEPNPPSGHIPVHIGSSYILPGNLKTSNGFLTTPITGRKRRPIGQLTIEYLVVHPIKDYSCDLSTSYSKYWKTSWRGLDIGHRGSGSSHGTNPTSCSNVRENTIGSLRHAGEHGADFVEFDVQLSKDFIPVLFHDFHVGIVTERKGEGSDVLTIPVKELTLEQLHKLKLVHKEEKDPSNGGEDGNEEFQLFPTLEKALQVLKPSIGFNIEIKWTMQLKDTTYELQHPHDLNFFLDTVLRVVLEHGCLRKIVFSCFHPDVCTMLRLKQNRYPVLFLTQGETERWPQYLDPRTHSVPHAIRFAKATELLGVNAHSEDLIRNPSLIQLVKDSGLVLFCWGEENNDPKIIRQLKAWGVDGVIYDKIDTYNEKVLKVSIFSLEEKLEVDMYL